MVDGCGCVIQDANHINDEVYLFGSAELSDEDFGISAIHVKIDGKLHQFKLKGKEYKVVVGTDGGNYDFYLPKSPNEQEILKALRNHSSWGEMGVEKNPNQKNSWVIGGMFDVFLQEGVEDYYLFTSGNYVLKLFKYKENTGMEGFLFFFK